MHFLGGGDADPQVATDLANANVFAPSQLSELASMVLDLIRDPRGSGIQERLGEFAETHGVNVPVLKNAAKGIIVFYRGAAKQNISADQLADDCAGLGLSKDAVSVLRGCWEARRRDLATASARTSLMANRLVDLEWTFGVTSATDELGAVGATFLNVKLVIDKGHGEREDIFMELTLAQFYEFMADMEEAKTYIDFLSS